MNKVNVGDLVLYYGREFIVSDVYEDQLILDSEKVDEFGDPVSSVSGCFIDEVTVIGQQKE